MFVSETENAKSHFLQIGCSCLIFFFLFLAVVITTVNLENQLFVKTNKISDIVFNRVLPAEFYAERVVP